MKIKSSSLPQTLRLQGTPKGYLCLVLHAHLPFVRHPESDYMLEENWLYEALTETYLPLLAHFTTLVDDRVPFRLSLSLTPTLCSMFTDALLQERYLRHLDKLIELAAKEIDRTAGRQEFSKTATMYYERFSQCRWLFEEVYGRNLVAAFKEFQDRGVLEILASAATHAFLPNMQLNDHAVRAQISVGCDAYRRHFGCDPKGFWLPECGFYPGLETILDKEGLLYFIVDTHGLLFAEPRPSCGVFAPIVCTGAPVAAFGRDAASSRSVWSAEEGYPGHPRYREFYRDIGFDLDIDYLRPYIDPIGIRVQTGIKYYRITDRKSPDKEPYRRLDALRIADEHAGDFMANRERQIRDLAPLMDRPPLIMAPYDAELFGHWWYEGPEWLNFLLRKIAFEQETVALVTPSDYLALHPQNQRSEPSFSSWGEGGFSAMWLNESNDWIYRHLSRIEELMAGQAGRYPDASGLLRRALNQMARELMLAESSDWAFIMKSGTMVNYAVRRTREHIANFLRLHDAIDKNALDEQLIASLESCNNIFPEIDYRVYA
ncbi:MAG: 1,4-alpha-glucan branching protein domain-containing protein [Chitinispirillaceae bacterium]|jgi:1,4-alpha-glucan branching enzyme